LLAQESFAAVGAFVDGDLAAGAGGRHGDGRAALLVSPAERGLPAGGAAVGLPAGRGKNRRWQTGHDIVPRSSRNGVRGVGFVSDIPGGSVVHVRVVRVVRVG